jgi:hypothetical protein
VTFVTFVSLPNFFFPFFSSSSLPFFLSFLFLFRVARFVRWHAANVNCFLKHLGLYSDAFFFFRKFANVCGLCPLHFFC